MIHASGDATCGDHATAMRQTQAAMRIEQATNQ
jgi:hypothetical protein